MKTKDMEFIDNAYDKVKEDLEYKSVERCHEM